MVEKATKVDCSMTDCLHYLRSGNQVYCKHVEKPYYMNCTTCPLYRLDWQKKAKTSSEYLKIFHRK